MRLSDTNYFPLAWPFLLLLAVIFVVVVVLVELEVLTYAYERMGIPRRYVFLVLFLSLLGSAINIPVAQLPAEEMVSASWVNFFGISYVVPVMQRWPGTIIAVNVGGAVIPVILSLYLLLRNRMYIRSFFSIALVAAVVHDLAYPIRGVGIGVPIFVPPIVAAVVAIVLGWRKAAPLAYICGSLGTLIGADLLNLGKIRGLGAPIASIGGAGTFDGVFLTGIIAVLLTPFSGARVGKS